MTFDPRRALTVAALRKQLAHLPDDTPILFNVEFEDGENWDTWNAFVVDMSELCPGREGCGHSEPEMLWEVVIGVKFGPRLGIMETLKDETGYERTT